ncbi:MAG: 2-oxo acid dehydrogenase subunit E2, partial [Betaproteobacteria bacterium]
MIEFKLPSLGADMDRGRLLEWRVRPGDTVRRGDVVAVVDTSKAAIDVEIWASGTVEALLLQPGDDVPVGTPMLTLLGEAEPAATAAEAPPAATAAGAVPSLKPSGLPTAPVPAAAPDVGRRRVSPAARRRAEELGVNLEDVPGTGPGGAVTIEDVQRAGTAKPQPTAIAERMSAMRQTIGAAMARSKREIPHYYLATEVPLERATDWLTRTNAERPVTARVLLAALLIKATALAARKYPEMNGFYRDGGFHPGA